MNEPYDNVLRRLTKREFREYNIHPVHLPEATTGMCKNHVRCKQFVTELANGYCIQCWDRGLGGRTGVPKYG